MVGGHLSLAKLGDVGLRAFFYQPAQESRDAREPYAGLTIPGYAWAFDIGQRHDHAFSRGHIGAQGVGVHEIATQGARPCAAAAAQQVVFAITTLALQQRRAQALEFGTVIPDVQETLLANITFLLRNICLLYTSPSPRD